MAFMLNLHIFLYFLHTGQALKYEMQRCNEFAECSYKASVAHKYCNIAVFPNTEKQIQSNVTKRRSRRISEPQKSGVESLK